jgi:hypothetical protein
MPRNGYSQDMFSSENKMQRFSGFTGRLLEESIFNGFLDHLLVDLEQRFGALSQLTVRLLNLLPAYIERLSDEDATAIEHHYQQNLPSKQSFYQQLRRWKELWKGVDKTIAPSTFTECLTNDRYSQSSYPNIMTILHILAVTLVTVATAERANSALKHVLTAKRAWMNQDRFNALVLLYIHRDVDLDFELVIDEYANRFLEE